MIVIGDEILSGRTSDININFLAKKLFKIGIELIEVRIVKDCKKSIIDAVVQFSKSFDYVFTCGGIGPTHDDITTVSIAQAFDREIAIHEEAREKLTYFYAKNGKKLNPDSLRMAMIPIGASLINNNLTGAPGYKIENVYVMAGVPKIFKAMVSSILPNLKTGKPILTKNHSFFIGESEIASPLKELLEEFSNLKIGSYPFSKGKKSGVNVVFSGRDSEILELALFKLKSTLEK